MQDYPEPLSQPPPGASHVSGTKGCCLFALMKKCRGTRQGRGTSQGRARGPEARMETVLVSHTYAANAGLLLEHSTASLCRRWRGPRQGRRQRQGQRQARGARQQGRPKRAQQEQPHGRPERLKSRVSLAPALLRSRLRVCSDLHYSLLVPWLLAPCSALQLCAVLGIESLAYMQDRHSRVQLAVLTGMQMSRAV